MSTATRNDNSRDTAELDERMVKVNRCAATVKGGRRFSFAATLVVGDGTGNIGLGYGKAVSVAAAVQKASKQARKGLSKVVLHGDTIPFQVEARVGASYVRLIPASVGTGVIAGSAVRAVVEVAGIKDVLTKIYGSTNQMNVAKATLEALKMLKSKEEVSALRGIKL